MIEKTPLPFSPVQPHPLLGVQIWWLINRPEYVKTRAEPSKVPNVPNH